MDKDSKKTNCKSTHERHGVEVVIEQHSGIVTKTVRTIKTHDPNDPLAHIR